MADERTLDYRIHILGPVTVSVGGVEVPLRPAEAKIIAFLTARRGETASADLILDEVWEGDPPEGARKTLGFHISHTRKTLRESGATDPLIETASGGYTLSTEHASVDADEFETAIEKAAAVVADAPETALAITESALALWRGDAYDGQYGIESVAHEARRLDEMRANARELRVRALIAAGRAEQAVSDALQIADEYPHRESVQALVMLALYESGRQRDALAYFDHARAALAEETGLEASRELANLASRIARQDATLSRAAGFDTEATAVLVPGTPFIGREKELDLMQQALETERLVSVVGSGGVGKTRLAGEFFGRASDVDHRVAYLGPVRTTGAVPTAIAEAFDASVPSGGNPYGAIASQVGDTDVTLFLDNAEHVLEPVTEAVRALLTRTPNLRIVLTTRQALGLPGEFVIRLDPLSTAQEDQPMSTAALMFVAAAARVDPHLELDGSNADTIHTITSYLDGLPLAIELAAAQLRRLSLDDLLALISSTEGFLAAPAGTRAARHSTLAAAIEWSYRMLSIDSRETLLALTVFHGGASLEAIATVADDYSDGLVDRLLDLVDRSLVMYRPSPTGSRYALLETTRRHLIELAPDNEVAQLRDRHLRWAADLVSKTAPLLTTPEEAAARDALDAEEYNVRSAIRWSIDHWPSIGMAIIGELKLYLVAKDHLNHEARDAARALDRPDADATDHTLASFHTTVGALGLLAGDLDECIPHYEEALRHLPDGEDATARFRSRNELALAFIESGRSTKAVELLATNRRWADESGELGLRAQVSMLEAQVAPPADQDAALLGARLEAEEAGRVSGVAYVTENRAWLLLQTGDYALAEREFRRSLNTWEQVGNEGAVNSSLCGIGVAQLKRGDVEDAIETLTEATAVGRRNAWSRGHGRALNRLAAAAWSAGDSEHAAACLDEAIGVWSDLPLQPGLAHARLLEARLAAATGDGSQAVVLAKRAREIWERFHRHDGIAACASLVASATGSEEARLDALQAQARAWTTPFILNGSLFPEVSSRDRWLADYEALSVQAPPAAQELARAVREASIPAWSIVANAAARYSGEGNSSNSEDRL